jgi:hypothetical protein
MLSLLLKLSFLKRIVALVAVGTGSLSPQAVTILSVVGLGTAVGAGAVMLRRSGSDPGLPRQDVSASPVLVAVIGLLIGGLATFAFLLVTGQ